jgi:streptogramin lyase
MFASVIVSRGTARAALGDITEFTIPTASAFPSGIVAGPDGNLWFTEQTKNAVAKVTTSGVVTEYPIPNSVNATPFGIALGPDGNLWFTENSANKIGRITIEGIITGYPIPTAASDPLDIAAGPDGNLWFTEGKANNVARVTTAGVITEFPITTPNSGPLGIAAGPDGNLWFTESKANKVAKVTTGVSGIRVTPAGVVTEYPILTASSTPSGITRGPDGNLWFTEATADQVAKVTTLGAITEYKTPTANASAQEIVAGPDGNLWFTEYSQSRVASVSTSGMITEYPTPSLGSGPFGIAAGPDGNVWFTETSLNNKVAVVAAGRNCTATAVPNSKTASSTKQYSLTNSDGATWQDIDSTNLRLSCMTSWNQSTLLTANADLWTANAAYNQDIGIFVSDNGASDVLLAWKESGGLAGTYSPNAAYVQALFFMTSGHTYVFKLKWKTNKPAAGATIFAAAGGGLAFSPTSLTAKTFPTGVTPNLSVSTKQYTLPNSDGATWQTIDAASLSTTIGSNLDSTAVLGANADLWTANAGFNQDLGIFVSDNGGPDTLVAWKESGGFAGTFSPNAAFVKAIYSMIGGHTYVFTLKWKTNVNAAGATIFAAAGNGPAYSQTSLLGETASGVYTALSTSQYMLPNSDGASWQPISDTLNLVLTPRADGNPIVSANADLWTANAGFNQDIGIFVSDNGGPDVLLAWKESGGFAGTYSPNAAFTQGTYHMTSGHLYVFKLKWKTNKYAIGATIFAAAGGPAPYSPTRLSVEFMA